MSMFIPKIEIRIDPSLKTYTMEAKVLVPNGCYAAAGATLGAPSGQLTIPEAEPVTLNIVKYDGMCTQALQVLEFRLERIPLTEGKTSLVAFATIGDNVVGVASKPIPQPRDVENLAGSVARPSGIQITSVNAWINAMPGDAPRLIAITNVFAPCMNYDFGFEDKGPFGTTGMALRVELKATLPGLCQKAIFEGPLRFERTLTSPREFDSIAIEFEGAFHFDPLEIIV